MHNVHIHIHWCPYSIHTIGLKIPPNIRSVTKNPHKLWHKQDASGGFVSLNGQNV